MSTVSQTPPRPRISVRMRWTLSALVPTAVVAVALRGAWTPMFQTALAARPHLPDMALLAAQPTAIRIHLGAALAALILGAVLMLNRKGRLFHRIAGWAWVSLVSLAAGSTLFITALNHGRWSILHLFTGWVLLVLPLGVVWAKRHDVARHRRTMMGLFYGGFAINLVVAFIPGRLLWTMFLG
jgi:uncharacterized membrane protein